MAKVGFIGLGQMGKWMALNVLKAGFDLTVYDISEAAVNALKEAGAKTAPSPKEMVGQVDWVFLSLPNTQVVESVLFGPGGIAEGANPGLIVVDLSTIGYMATLGFAERLAQQGVVFVDAPVSGMEARAKDGTLTVMFGGDEAVFQTVYPVFQAIGNTIIHMGKIGSGQLTKLINQLLFNTACAAMAEILPMAVKLGLDPEKIAQVIVTGTGRSFAVEFFTPRILENKFDEGYPLKHAYKDMISAAEISAHQKIPLPMVHAATTTYQMALAQGLGDEDKGAMIKVFERILGVEFRKRKG